MSRVIFDGFNLALEEGTGVATYARMLTKVAHELGHKVGIIYGSPQAPSRNPVLREIGFSMRNAQPEVVACAEIFSFVADRVRYYLPVKPKAVELSGVVVTRQFDDILPSHR